MAHADAIKVSHLSTSLNFYLDMVYKGVKVPFVKQLRMAFSLEQYFGGKEF